MGLAVFVGLSLRLKKRQRQSARVHCSWLTWSNSAVGKKKNQKTQLRIQRKTLNPNGHRERRVWHLRLYRVLFRSWRLLGLFWGEIDIGLDIITVFRVLFIFNNFIFINNADVDNCRSFKSFGYIYIYIYIDNNNNVFVLYFF